MSSDEAFGFFVLKYYSEIPANVKKPHKDREDRKKRKEKLSRKKLLIAIKDYDNWLMQIRLLHEKMSPRIVPLAKDIKEHCKQFREMKFKKKKGIQEQYTTTNSLQIAIGSLLL